MLGIHDLPLFVASGLLLNLAPGPDSLLVMSRSAAQGWRAGSAAALGIGAGTFVHVFAAALGLSALLATSTAAFTIVKYVGAAYLLYVGLAMLRGRPSSARESEPAAATTRPVAYRKLFLQGLLTNVLNPKVAMFFLAFVPQFISPQSPDKALAFIALGCIFNVGGVAWCHVLAVSSAFAGHRLRASRAVAVWLNRLIGVVFVSFGIRLALADKG